MDPEDEDAISASRAAAFDFLGDLLEDRAEGRTRPLSEYLARYPRHQDAVACEYARFLEEERQAVATQEGAEEDPGQHLGAYRLLRHLGSGGQGEVWLAEDTRLRREVAIKRLLGLVTEERRGRLEREAKAAARLAHPGICGLLDAELQGQEPYLVMEYVEGEDLSVALHRVREARGLGSAGARRTGGAGASGELGGADKPGRLEDEDGPWMPRDRSELGQVLYVFERLARALHAAHRAGLVHRDVKPGNLRLARDGAPVLLDFGLATGGSEDTALTRAGEVHGTPAYMSPEQVRGTPGDELGPGTDVYSAGVTLYEALTGAPPFSGASRHALERAIQERALPPARSGDWLLPADVQAVLQTACDKELGRRYESALDFAEDLRRLRAWEPVQARPVGAPLRIWRWARRQPLAAGSLATLLVTLLSALLVTLVLLRDKDRALDRALGEQLTYRVPQLLEISPASALALGVEALERTPGERARSVLYAPLEMSLLKAVYSLPDDRQPIDMALHEGRLAGASGESESRRLFVLDRQGRLWAWDLAAPKDSAGRPVLDLPGRGAASGMLALGASGRYLAYALDQGSCGVVDLISEELLWSRSFQGEVLSAVDLDAIGGRFALQAQDGSTRMLGMGDGEVLWEQQAAGRHAGQVRFACRGERVLTSGGQPVGGLLAEGRQLHLWDAVGGEALGRLEHDHPVTGVDLDPSGLHIVSADQGGWVRRWDAATAKPKGQPWRIPVPAGPVALGPLGRRVAVATGAGSGGEGRDTTWLKDFDAEGPALELKGHSAPIQALEFSRDGRRLVSAAFDSTARIWDVASGRLERVGRGFIRPVRLVMSANGQDVFVGDRQDQLHVFGLGPTPFAYRVAGAAVPVVWASFGPDGESAVLAAEDGSLRLVATPAEVPGPGEPEPGQVLERRSDLAGPLRGGAMGREGQVLLWNAAGELAHWLPADAQSAASLGALTPPLRAATPIGAGRLAVIDGEGALWWGHVAGTLLQWEAAELGPRSEPHSTRGSQLEAAPRCVDLLPLPGRDELCVLLENQSLQLWHPDRGLLRQGEPWPGIPGNRKTPAGLGFVPGAFGSLVVVRCADRCLRLFDLGPPLAGEGFPAPKVIASFTPDLAALARNSVAVADTRKAKRIQGLPLRAVPIGQLGALAKYPSRHHGEAVTCLAGDGGRSLVATGSSDGSVAVWDTTTGEVITWNDLHGVPLAGVALSPGEGDLRVLSVDDSGAARVWPVWPGPAARAQMGRELYAWERRAELDF